MAFRKIKLKTENIFFAVAFFVALVISLIILLMGNRQFGGWDGGIMINGAYQTFLGYEPYKDFLTAFPPLFLIGTDLAFRFFGVRWFSFVEMASIFAFCTFLLQVYIFYKLKFNKIFCILIPLLCQSLTMISISYWWYNQVTAISGVLFISAAVLLFRDSKSLVSKIIFVAATSLLILLKINIAGFLIVSFFLFYLTTKLRFQAILLFIASAILAFLILISFQIDTKYLLLNYFGEKGRVFSYSTWHSNLLIQNREEAVSTFFLVSPFLIIGAFIILKIIFFSKYKKESIPHFFFIFVSIITGFLGMGTNNEHKMVDAIFIVVAIFYAFTWFSEKAELPELFRKVFYVSVFLIIFYGFSTAVSRTRIKSVGPGIYYQDTHLEKISEPAFFKDLYASPNLLFVLSQLKETLRLANYLGNSHASVFFGPRIDFGYAVFGQIPPKNSVLYYESQIACSAPTGEEITSYHQLMEKKIKLALFLRDDYTYYPKDLVKYLFNNYDVYKYQALSIHILRGDKSLEDLRNKLESGIANQTAIRGVYDDRFYGNLPFYCF